MAMTLDAASDDLGFEDAGVGKQGGHAPQWEAGDLSQADFSLKFVTPRSFRAFRCSEGMQKAELGALTGLSRKRAYL